MPVNVPSASGKYVVGVGDKFQLMLTGTTKVSSASSEEQMVQRDGTITIPNIGKLRIAAVHGLQKMKSVTSHHGAGGLPRSVGACSAARRQEA